MNVFLLKFGVYEEEAVFKVHAAHARSFKTVLCTMGDNLKLLFA